MAESARQAPQEPEQEEVYALPSQAANDNEQTLGSSLRGAEQGNRISNLTAVALITVAILSDGAQFVASFFHVLIPIVGSALAFVLTWYIGMVAQILFAMWFALLGVDGGTKSKAFATRILIYMSVFVVELVPLLNALPAITFGVVALILLARAEDLYGGDIRNVRLSQLRTLIRGHLPVMQTASALYNRMRGQIDAQNPALAAEAKRKAEEQGRSRTQYQDEFKQKQMKRAMDIDLSGARFTSDAEALARRRAGSGGTTK